MTFRLMVPFIHQNSPWQNTPLNQLPKGNLNTKGKAKKHFNASWVFHWVRSIEMARSEKSILHLGISRGIWFIFNSNQDGILNFIWHLHFFFPNWFLNWAQRENCKVPFYFTGQNYSEISHQIESSLYCLSFKFK